MLPGTFGTPRHRPANHWPSACKVFLGLYSRIKGSLPEHSRHDKTKRSIGRGRGGEVKGEGGAQNENRADGRGPRASQHLWPAG